MIFKWKWTGKKNPEPEVSHTIVRVENKDKSCKGNLDVQSRQNPQWKTDPSNCMSPGSKTHAKSPEEGGKKFWSKAAETWNLRLTRTENTQQKTPEMKGLPGPVRRVAGDSGGIFRLPSQHSHLPQTINQRQPFSGAAEAQNPTRLACFVLIIEEVWLLSFR